MRPNGLQNDTKMTKMVAWGHRGDPGDPRNGKRAEKGLRDPPPPKRDQKMDRKPHKCEKGTPGAASEAVLGPASKKHRFRGGPDPAKPSFSLSKTMVSAVPQGHQKVSKMRSKSDHFGAIWGPIGHQGHQSGRKKTARKTIKKKGRKKSSSELRHDSGDCALSGFGSGRSLPSLE